MLRVAPLLLVLGFLYGAPDARPNWQGGDAEDPVIDLAVCKQETRIAYSKFGSEKIVVKGKRGGRCVIERTSETEGAYVTRECRVPVSLRKLRFGERPDTATGAAGKCDDVRGLGGVAKHCKVVKTGNVLLESN